MRSVVLVKDIFSGECKGFATVSMEGHEGRAATELTSFGHVDTPNLAELFVATVRGAAAARAAAS